MMNTGHRNRDNLQHPQPSAATIIGLSLAGGFVVGL
jgi:hypothetical protein